MTNGPSRLRLILCTESGRPRQVVIPPVGIYAARVESRTTTHHQFTLHTPSTTTGKAAELLGDLWSRHDGKVGPMVRSMAGSPSVLAGYLDLSRAMKRSTLARPISARISLAIQQRLGCGLCLEAHSSAARSVGVTDDEIDAARHGTSADPAIAAIIRFAVRLDSRPAEVDVGTIDELRAFGYSDGEILDVVGLVALNLLTGTFNLVAGLEPEPLPHQAPTIRRAS